MFNPYYARPIGSDKFLNHLLSLMTEREEVRNEEREALPEIPVHFMVEYEPPTSFDPIMEGYKALAFAVLAQAIFDYLSEYEARLVYEDEDRYSRAYVHECRCLTLENEYFRDDDEHSALLDGILHYVIHNPEDHGKLKWRLERIKSCKSRLSKVIHNS